MNFYKVDGKIIISDTPIGEPVIPNTTDGAHEKHVPVIEQHGDFITVKVGSVEHPMLDVHYIEWIVLETATGYQKHDLKPGERPEAHFAVTECVAYNDFAQKNRQNSPI